MHANIAINDAELFSVLNRFPSGPPIRLYHVDATGNLLRAVEQNGGQIHLRPGEFWLTTNVETRSGFKGGAGLNHVLAIDVDRRFVALLAETSMLQTEVGKVQKMFAALLGVELAIPRVTFEGGGKGKTLSTGDVNISLKMTAEIPEWSRLFRMSAVKVEHMKLDTARPAGQQLVTVKQIFPVQGPPSGGSAGGTAGGGEQKSATRRTLANQTIKSTLSAAGKLARGVARNQNGMAMFGAALGHGIQALGDYGMQQQVEKELNTVHKAAIESILARDDGVLVIVRKQEWKSADFNGMRARGKLGISSVVGGPTQEAAMREWTGPARLLPGPAKGWQTRPEEYLWIPPIGK